MRLDSHNFSPAIAGKVARAAARNTSFAVATESLNDEAEISLSDRQVERIAHELGEQLRRDRERRTEAFRQKRATPEAPVVPGLAVVFIDGGRLQARTEGAGQGPGVSDPAWREDKVAKADSSKYTNAE